MLNWNQSEGYAWTTQDIIGQDNGLLPVQHQAITKPFESLIENEPQGKTSVKILLNNKCCLPLEAMLFFQELLRAHCPHTMHNMDACILHNVDVCIHNHDSLMEIFISYSSKFIKMNLLISFIYWYPFRYSAHALDYTTQDCNVKSL